jgi:uncharacterized protein
MDAALIASAALLGLLGSPHCAAMCGAPCAVVTQHRGAGRPGAALAAFLGARMVGYAVGGAAVAAGVMWLASLGFLGAALRPVWTALHLAALGLGLWLLLTGRLPLWLGRIGRIERVAAPQPLAGGWQRMHQMKGPMRAGAAGALWVALPCGLLQSALLIAALANTPAHGAAAMMAFAATSSLGLGLYPAVWARWFGSAAASPAAGVLAARLAGAVLAASSGWALGHGLWQRVSELCLGG